MGCASQNALQGKLQTCSRQSQSPCVHVGFFAKERSAASWRSAPGRVAILGSAGWGLVSLARASAEPGHPRLRMGCTPPSHPAATPARHAGSWGGRRSQMCPAHWRTRLRRQPHQEPLRWKVLGAGQGRVLAFWCLPFLQSGSLLREKNIKLQMQEQVRPWRGPVQGTHPEGPPPAPPGELRLA